jgi:hypothetical protein
MTVAIWVENDEGEPVELELPSKFVVCARCMGRGSHVNPSIDGNGLSREDFDEAGPEFFDDYMAGVYDVACYSCGGKRVVELPDLQKLTAAERVLWDAHVAEEDLDRAIAEAERRAGA